MSEFEKTGTGVESRGKVDSGGIVPGAIIRIARSTTLGPQTHFEKAEYTFEICKEGFTTPEALQAGMAELKRIADGFAEAFLREWAHLKGQSGAKQPQQGDGQQKPSPDPRPWRPWPNGRGESLPVSEDPELANRLLEGHHDGRKPLRFGGYRYWLYPFPSEGDDGSKSFIQRVKEGE